jgi:hypothetical protein
MSTSRHQQTDGGAEVMIRVVKDTLKKITNHKKDNWVELLPLVQFAINNSTHSATGFTPFYLAHGFDVQTFPQFQRKPATPLNEQFSKYLDDLETAHIALWSAREKMIQTYDKKHNSPPPSLEVGSFVLLDRDGIRWQPDSEVGSKLLQPYIGPFEVTHYDKERRNVTLKLPTTMKCHNIFHLSKIKPWVRANENFPDRIVPNEPPPEIDEFGESNWEVELILDSRIKGRWKKREFLVKWKGYDSSHNSWEPLSNLSNCQEAIALYLSKYPIPNFSLEDAYSARGGVAKNTSLKALS